MLVRCLTALLVFTVVRAQLTDDELAMFTNDGSMCGGDALSLTDNGDSYTIDSTGLPDHQWQCVNPNAPSDQAWSYEFPKNPVVNDVPRCLPFSVIGFAKNGVPFYSPMTHLSLNAVEGGSKEDFDACGGHATDTGAYHYHLLPNAGDYADLGCENPIYDNDDDSSQFLGVALDGHPIYSQGDDIASDDLDSCHGMYGDDGRYRYIAMDSDYPYIAGCFVGDIIDDQVNAPECSAEIDSNLLCECDGTSYNWHEFCDVTCDDDDGECSSCSRRGKLMQLKEKEE